MNKLMRSMATALWAMSTFVFLSCDDDSDIIGLNDAAKYGYIKVTLEGNRPDGEAYKATRNFRFASSSGPSYSSSVYTSEDGDFYRSFEVVRYAGAINESVEGEANEVSMYLGTREDVETGELLDTYGEFFLRIPLTTDDKKYFNIYEWIDIDMENITGYKYNPKNGKLSFKYVAEQSNEVGTPLKVTITVNVTVFENIYSQGLIND